MLERAGRAAAGARQRRERAAAAEGESKGSGKLNTGRFKDRSKSGQAGCWVPGWGAGSVGGRSGGTGALERIEIRRLRAPDEEDKYKMQKLRKGREESEGDGEGDGDGRGGRGQEGRGDEKSGGRGGVFC